MSLAVVFVDAVGTDVPAAIVAAGNFVVAAIAEERPTQEKLLKASARLLIQLARIERHMQLIATAFAAARIIAR